MAEGPDAALTGAVLRLDGRALGAMLGLLLGGGLFLATNWLVLKGGPPGADGRPLVGPHLGLLAQYFPGYRVSLAGSLIGFAWMFALGALSGRLLAAVYNRLARAPGRP